MSFHDNIWLYAGLLAALLALAVFAAAARARRRNLRAFASAKLLPELSRSFSPVKSHIKAALWILAVFAIFVALARPQYGYRWEEAKTKGVDVIFAIDVSKSMLPKTSSRTEWSARSWRLSTSPNSCAATAWG